MDYSRCIGGIGRGWFLGRFAFGWGGSDVLGVGRKRLERFGGGVVAFVEVETIGSLRDELFDGQIDGRAADEDAMVGDFGQVDVHDVVAPVEEVVVAAVGRFFAQVRVGRTVHPHHLQLDVTRFQVPIFIRSFGHQSINQSVSKLPANRFQPDELIATSNQGS